MINPQQTQLPQAATWIVNPVDGTKQKIEAGEPIVIQSPPVRTDGVAPMMMQMKDENGNPMVMDIQSLISLKRFEGEQKRDMEKHNALLSTLGQLRKELPVAIKAFAATVSQRAAAPTPRAPQPLKVEPPPVIDQAILPCPHCSKPVKIAELSSENTECPHCQKPLQVEHAPGPGAEEQA